VTRIVAGSAGGRRIAVPPGSGTRPTADRTREALFSSLGALTEIEDCVIADLYAGSGAVGLEALSRGAAHALFVESDPRAAATIRDNLRDLGLPGGELRVDRVLRHLTAGPRGRQYDVVFADPPYAVPGVEVDAILDALVDHGWLAADAVVVLERPYRGPVPVWPTPLAGIKERRYGDSMLRYGRAP
jgi:16S rRNA (guanine966-N2)-methyltransferase